MLPVPWLPAGHLQQQGHCWLRAKGSPGLSFVFGFCHEITIIITFLCYLLAAVPYLLYKGQVVLYFSVGMPSVFSWRSISSVVPKSWYNNNIIRRERLNGTSCLPPLSCRKCTPFCCRSAFTCGLWIISLNRNILLPDFPQWCEKIFQWHFPRHNKTEMTCQVDLQRPRSSRVGVKSFHLIILLLTPVLTALISGLRYITGTLNVFMCYSMISVLEGTSFL